MKKHGLVFLIVIVVVSSLDGCATKAASDETTNTGLSPIVAQPAVTPVLPTQTEKNWQASIEGNLLNWNGRDLRVQINGGKEAGVFSTIAQNYCLALQKGPDRTCYCGHSLRLASVVGNLVSLDHESDFSCQGSYLHWRYASLDLSKTGSFAYPRLVEFGGGKPLKTAESKSIVLGDLFPESEILGALLANQEISQEISNAISEGRITTVPQSLEQLGKYFANHDSTLRNGETRLAEDFLARFAFHHLDGEKVAVWISLSPTSHAGQANQEHLEILLPVPKKLRTSLLLADSRKEGFLIKDARQIVGDNYAIFEFSNGKTVE